jgi:hypothetical protein
VPAAGSKPCRARVAVQRDLLRELVAVLIEHVGQQVGADFAGAHEGLRIAGRRDPDGSSGCTGVG